MHLISTGNEKVHTYDLSELPLDRTHHSYNTTTNNEIKRRSQIQLTTYRLTDLVTGETSYNRESIYCIYCKLVLIICLPLYYLPVKKEP